MRYSRTNLYEIETVNNITEYDLLLNNFEKFVVTRPTNFYTVIQTDLKRPDVISLKCYGNVDYFWIILKYNAVCDPQNDLEVGDILIVPDQLDIDSWFLECRKRN